ncbi:MULTISPECIES: Asp-tRNA(Asn)/Glu-tRNA(Gln) amidotransferase subunit GatC [Thermodesulfovibrio]|uniref:Aspartyl/glutamyl-tRNA(Asn/Gln) amidotransferase subunit C n=1 Tax=Thermodesulfovibrio yellowstonii (strain ATCC 51303 / DSM 11347 / YP87) TaxID=289376 RepID=GATC_THEYD|nr:MULTISPECIES: Asp-tRNA(Asn)/Glu-tRNA(Gln) amidotransferase subunit GatC [Thermodesulfovibrio]B5YHS7.1 RecName: Full=Aspartyl/glutamyl-tRNA(Asn/Gln) amidotransferase subunit C; Short=Asp/Glu-ADT subunit C [Thermodesulfovibrio yellowstonii DSM 11347]ACI20246.1 glutamyl-tRNA(Gln) amidotransferase, C subunit [Thermodesulfovibrio yellowstonii DSM 11347]MDI6865877.1 Asp-tRNA(Asn)/Glu-tRNA(Gln) amidotransferase subunit GatC [Thermodesulfovibrio yellowstonii]
MKISKEEVKHIAMLSRLELNEEEIGVYQEQLSRILDYIEKLNEIDTTLVEPTSHVIELKNVFRDDNVKGSISRDEALKNAPDQTDKFFRVPKIIE